MQQLLIRPACMQMKLLEQKLQNHTHTQNKAQSFLHVNGQNLSRTVNSFYNSYNLHNTENTLRSSLV